MKFIYRLWHWFTRCPWCKQSPCGKSKECQELDAEMQAFSF